MDLREWLIVGTAASFLAAGCGASSPPPATPAPPPVVWTTSKPADAGALVTRDVVAEPSLLGQLGTGWSASAADTRQRCVVGTAVTSPSTDGTLRRLAHPFSPQEVDGFAAGAERRRFDFDWSPASRPAAWDDPLAARLVYGVEWRVGTERYAPGSTRWFLDAAAAGFHGMCGDAYYGEIDTGGMLLLELHFSFATRADRERFRTLLGDEPAIWDLAPVLSAHGTDFGGRIDLGLGVSQHGGDVTTIGQGLSAEALMACGWGGPSHCNELLQQFVDKALATGPGSTADGIATSPGQLGYRMAAYSELGGPPARTIPAPVTTAIGTATQILTQQMVLRRRLETLSRFGLVTPAYPSGVDAALTALDRGRAALRVAAGSCFLVDGPEDAAGIDRCLTAMTPAQLALLGFDASLTLDAFPLP